MIRVSPKEFAASVNSQPDLDRLLEYDDNKHRSVIAYTDRLTKVHHALSIQQRNSDGTISHTHYIK